MPVAQYGSQALKCGLSEIVAAVALLLHRETPPPPGPAAPRRRRFLPRGPGPSVAGAVAITNAQSPVKVLHFLIPVHHKVPTDCSYCNTVDTFHILIFFGIISIFQRNEIRYRRKKNTYWSLTGLVGQKEDG